MRVTLNLPDDLVAQARDASNSQTNRATMVAALDEFAKGRLRARLVARLGRTRLRMTYDDIEALRDDDDDPDPGERMRLMLPPEGGCPCIGCRTPATNGS